MDDIIVLKKGIPPEDKRAKTTCNTCNSQLLVRLKALKFVADQREGDFYKGKCPVCGAEIFAYERDVMAEHIWKSWLL